MVAVGWHASGECALYSSGMGISTGGHTWVDDGDTVIVGRTHRRSRSFFIAVAAQASGVLMVRLIMFGERWGRVTV